MDQSSAPNCSATIPFCSFKAGRPRNAGRGEVSLLRVVSSGVRRSSKMQSAASAEVALPPSIAMGSSFY